MVDPTALAKQIKEKQTKFTPNLRAFVFSLLGAVVGGVVCLIIDYFFMGNVTGVLYLFTGMSAYAFYQYFVEKKDQNKKQILILILACVLATLLTVFLESMLLYAPNVQQADMNILEKTFFLYKENILNNGIFSYKESFSTDGKLIQYQLSLIAIHAVCAIMSVIAMLLSWLLLGLASKSWENKHKGDNTNYSYSSRKKKVRKKK